MQLDFVAGQPRWDERFHFPRVDSLNPHTRADFDAADVRKGRAHRKRRSIQAIAPGHFPEGQSSQTQSHQKDKSKSSGLKARKLTRHEPTPAERGRSYLRQLYALGNPSRHFVYYVEKEVCANGG